jgi:predicted DNA-binding protein
MKPKNRNVTGIDVETGESTFSLRINEQTREELYQLSVRTMRSSGNLIRWLIHIAYRNPRLIQEMANAELEETVSE